MSNVSMGFAPPFIQSRMQRLPTRAAWVVAACECASPPQLGIANPPAVARAPLRKARRSMCPQPVLDLSLVPSNAWLFPRQRNELNLRQQVGGNLLLHMRIFFLNERNIHYAPCTHPTH